MHPELRVVRQGDHCVLGKGFGPLPVPAKDPTKSPSFHPTVDPTETSMEPTNSMFLFLIQPNHHWDYYIFDVQEII